MLGSRFRVPAAARSFEPQCGQGASLGEERLRWAARAEVQALALGLAMTGASTMNFTSSSGRREKASQPFNSAWVLKVGETTWKAIDKRAGHRHLPREVTISNGLVRKVVRFDAQLAKRALAVNRPTRLVLNQLDCVGRERERNRPNGRLRKFIEGVETDIGRKVDWLGFSGWSIVDRPAWTA